MLLVQDIRERPTPAQLRRLRTRLPYSAPLLRRLEVAGGAYVGGGRGRSSNGTTAHAHVLFVYEAETEAAAAAGTQEPDPDGLPLDAPFAAAYVDVSQSPETAAWLFCSDEAPPPPMSTGGFYAEDNDADPATWLVDRGAALVASWSSSSSPSSQRAVRCHRLALALLRQIHALAVAAEPVVYPLMLVRVAAAIGGGGAKEAAAAAVAAAAREPLVGSVTDPVMAAATLTTHLKATLHDGVRYLLEHPPDDGGLPVKLTYWDAYDKWLFRAADVPARKEEEKEWDDIEPFVVETADEQTGETKMTTLTWDRVRRGDVPLVVSRTAIPRTEVSLLAVPSVALRATSSTDDSAIGPLAAWAFLGVDGSLWTLHCEPAFRGRGLATAVAARLFQQNGGLFRGKKDSTDDTDDTDDNNLWLVADVSATNRASQAVCRRLGGRRAWSSSWIVVAYDSLGG